MSTVGLIGWNNAGFNFELTNRHNVGVERLYSGHVWYRKHNLQRNCGQTSLSCSFRWNPLLDLLAGGWIGNILLTCPGHVDLMNLSIELLGLQRVCGGWVVCHTVQPAVPEEHRRNTLLMCLLLLFIGTNLSRVKQKLVPFSRNHAAVHIPQSLFPIHLCGVDHPAVTSCVNKTKQTNTLVIYQNNSTVYQIYANSSFYICISYRSKHVYLYLYTKQEYYNRNKENNSSQISIKSCITSTHSSQIITDHFVILTNSNFWDLPKK